MMPQNTHHFLHSDAFASPSFSVFFSVGGWCIGHSRGLKAEKIIFEVTTRECVVLLAEMNLGSEMWAVCLLLYFHHMIHLPMAVATAARSVQVRIPMLAGCRASWKLWLGSSSPETCIGFPPCDAGKHASISCPSCFPWLPLGKKHNYLQFKASVMLTTWLSRASFCFSHNC